MWLPTSTAPGAQWQLYDFKQVTLTSEPAAEGRALVQHGPVPQDELWLIDRMVVSSDSITDTSAGVYVDTVDPGRAIDGTTVGNFDVADLAAPIQLAGGVALVCAWDNAAAGAVGTLRLQYQVLRRPA